MCKVSSELRSLLTTYLFTIHQFQITLVHLSRHSVCGGRFPVIWTPQLSITWTRSGTIFVTFCRKLVSYIYCVCISKILFIIILSLTFMCTVHSNRDKRGKCLSYFQDMLRLQIQIMKSQLNMERTPVSENIKE